MPLLFFCCKCFFGNNLIFFLGFVSSILYRTHILTKDQFQQASQLNHTQLCISALFPTKGRRPVLSVLHSSGSAFFSTLRPCIFFCFSFLLIFHNGHAFVAAINVRHGDWLESAWGCIHQYWPGHKTSQKLYASQKKWYLPKKWHFSGPLKPRKKFGASPMGYFPRGGGVQESVLWSRPH